MVLIQLGWLYYNYNSRFRIETYVFFRFQVRQSFEFFNRSKSPFHNSNGMHGFQFHPQMTNHLQQSICLQYVGTKEILVFI